jgi:thiamine biosynthesis protein ThiS
MPDTTKPGLIEVIVNGERRSMPEGQTVEELLLALELEPSRVAVELDRAILKRPLWPHTALRDGCRLEIVHFVGGG